MATREGFLDRAIRMRAALETVNDPVSRTILEAVIGALDAAAAVGRPVADGKQGFRLVEGTPPRGDHAG